MGIPAPTQLPLAKGSGTPNFGKMPMMGGSRGPFGNARQGSVNPFTLPLGGPAVPGNRMSNSYGGNFFDPPKLFGGPTKFGGIL